MTPKAIAFAIAGFLLSAAAALGVASVAVAKLEESTLRTTRSALVASGQSWGTVETDGTWVVFNGTAPDEKGRIQALSVLTAVVSSSRIKNQTDVEDAVEAIAPDFTLEILRSGTDVSLIGITPNESIDDPIRAAIASIDGVSLIDMKESTDWAPPEGWEQALSFGAEVMTRVERAKISVSPAHVVLTAVVKSDQEKTLLEAALFSIKPEMVALEIDITAPRPIFSPYSLVFERTETDTTLLCHALTAEDADMIVQAAQKYGAPANATCEIGLGAPTQNWAILATFGFDVIHEMGTGRFEMQNSGITITAPRDFDADRFAAILVQYNNQLPEAYILRSVLPVSEVAVTDTERPYFEGKLSDDGNVILSGVTIDAISQTTLLNFSEAKFGIDTVNDKTKLADFAPHGWTSRQLVAIEVLSLLNFGQITVTETSVDVTGEGEVIDLAANIRERLENGFGAGAQFNIDVTEIIVVPPEPVFPDETLCETEIAALLAENQILFAQSSAVIDPQSESMISEIALILNRCRHAIFEIGGHTDSSGREEMNQSLSQNRAGAVLDSLLARNMLLGDISVIGYGESQPIAENETEEGRVINRRIAFRLIDEMPVASDAGTSQTPATMIEAPLRRPASVSDAEPETPSEEN